MSDQLSSEMLKQIKLKLQEDLPIVIKDIRKDQEGNFSIYTICFSYISKGLVHTNNIRVLSDDKHYEGFNQLCDSIEGWIIGDMT